MKKILASFAFLYFASNGYAQNNGVNNILVRHDTTTIKAEESEWIIKSLVKNEPSLTSELGKPLSMVLLQAIAKGKLKAIDPETNKPIPAKDIHTWKMGSDTVPEYDDAGNVKGYQVMKQMHSSQNLNRVRIYQDWYFNVANGKFTSEIKWIELLEEVKTPTGFSIGHAVLCRIFY